MLDGFKLGRVNGTSYYRTGNGPVLVLIHGVGMHAGFWAPQLAAFTGRWDVLAYDTLGHGGSPLPPERPTLRDYSNQLRELLDGLGIFQVCVAGHSMGALIALEFALSHPDRVGAVVAMNAVYCRTPAQREAVVQRAALLHGGGVADMAWRQAALDRWFGAPVPPAQLENTAWVGASLAAVDAVGYARAYGLFASADGAHAGRLRELAMPALFLTGEEDHNSSPEMSRQMAREAPLGSAVALPGERHMMSLTSPGAVNAALDRFLTPLCLTQAAQ